jgi:hypothetical protein
MEKAAINHSWNGCEVIVAQVHDRQQFHLRTVRYVQVIEPIHLDIAIYKAIFQPSPVFASDSRTVA